MTQKSKMKVEARARQTRFSGSYAAQLNQLKGTNQLVELTVRAHAEQILAIARDRRGVYSAWTASICKRDGTDLPIMRLSELFGLDKSDPTYPANLAVDKADQRLHKAVRSLPDEVLRKIQAVMYMGRDGDEYEDVLQNLKDHKHAVRAEMVAGKVPLDEYLEAGLRLVDERGIDLQAALQPD